MKDAYALSRILLADVYDATAEPESAPAPPRQRLRRLALTLSTLLFAAAHASPERRGAPDEALDRPERDDLDDRGLRGRRRTLADRSGAPAPDERGARSQSPRRQRDLFRSGLSRNSAPGPLAGPAFRPIPSSPGSSSRGRAAVRSAAQGQRPRRRGSSTVINSSTWARLEPSATTSNLPYRSSGPHVVQQESAGPRTAVEHGVAEPRKQPLEGKPGEFRVHHVLRLVGRAAVREQAGRPGSSACWCRPSGRCTP